MPRYLSTVVAVGFTFALFTGCTNNSSEYKPATELPQHADDHDHVHGAEGPHHGALVELGDGHHAEVVLDAAGHKLVVYLLGSDMKSPLATSAKELTLTPEGGSQLTLRAAAGQTDGQNSVFELQDEKVVHGLEEDGFIHGNLSVHINDKPYQAFVDAHFEDDHDHAHDEKPVPAADKTDAKKTDTEKTDTENSDTEKTATPSEADKSNVAEEGTSPPASPESASTPE